MTHEETKQAIAGFAEFFKGITGNQDIKIPNDLAKQYGLEQEPSGDLISRAEAIKAIDEKAKRIKNEDTLNGLAGAVGILFDLPPVNPQEQKYCDRNICLRNEYRSIGCDECEVTKSQEPCEDAISRQALLDAFGFSEKTRKWGGDHSGYNTMMLYEIQDMIESAPPVNPQEKTGHWITKIKSDLRGDMWPTNPKCSECGGEPYYSNTIYNYKFCPYCGAKMVEPQESEG